MPEKKLGVPQAIYLKDYAPPAYLVDEVELRFDLDPSDTRVWSRLKMRRNPRLGDAKPPLALDGNELELLELILDDRLLQVGEYHVDDERLEIAEVPETFTLQVSTRIHPARNTALEGLYASDGMLCTQCEAEGFRRMTYYPDRPDVMARFTTTLVADRTRFPILLSNGNDLERGEDGARHWVRWQDPHPKPCYLFALVAGDLALVEDRYTTRSGREIALRFYVEHSDEDKCAHAVQSLKRAMRWDERTFGLEYDLDTYMVVAVSHFNMGAMENKGLNIFNSKYVLARPDTATDSDFVNIQGVIGHEYFHNWTGNRVTCRDWFQLSLKEGLTVFRDQEFTADQYSRAVKRIGDVRYLRTAQFAEDGGPMAHPVRPDSYIEINNFYTLTVYEKGAELIRMIHALTGPEGFRRGMDLYFERHDGQAVTTDDFVKAMEDANDLDLAQFRRWYSQAGTPELRVETDYDPASGVFTLRVAQSCPATPGQPEKGALHIPLVVGLIGPDGRDLPLKLSGEGQQGNSTRVLELREREQEFRFEGITKRPVPSLLRGFSAPVKLYMDASDEDLAFQLAHDDDPFNRWDAGFRLATTTILTLVKAQQQGDTLELPDTLADAFATVLDDASLDPAFSAEVLALPSEAYISDQLPIMDVESVYKAREFTRQVLAMRLKARLQECYREKRVEGPYEFEPPAVGRRRLSNLCLSYLMSTGDDDIVELAMQHYHGSDNMTDCMGALVPLANLDRPERNAALADFYERWKAEPLVVDKWFAIQASSNLPNTLDEVRNLLDHPAFDLRNPNRARSLIGAFCHGNPLRFHEFNGRGYEFLAEQVLRLDPLNPQVASRLVSAFTRWRRFDLARQQRMRAQLERIASSPTLSPDVYEVVHKSL